MKKKIYGTKIIPRLSVYKSNKYIYAQLIDDEKQKTLAEHSSFKKKDKNINIQKSKEIGEILAEKAIKKGINRIVFNRSKYKYHGRVKALAEGIKKKGIKI